MAAGKLKMWNSTRGFGFIADDSGGPDMFLHVNDLKSAGIDPDKIKVGDRLTFDTASTRDGKMKASADSIAKLLGRYVGSVRTKALELRLILSKKVKAKGK